MKTAYTIAYNDCMRGVRVRVVSVVCMRGVCVCVCGECGVYAWCVRVCVW